MTISYFCHYAKRRGGGGQRLNVMWCKTNLDYSYVLTITVAVRGHSVGIYGAEPPPVSVAASYSMQVFERSRALLTQRY